MTESLEAFKQLMRQAKLDDLVIRTFADYYRQLVAGVTGKLSRDTIDAPDAERVIDYRSLPEASNEYLSSLVIVKLNGGLGTSMGLSKAKSLLPVKNGLSFLDIIARQVLALRHQAPVPLLFMNSFSTREDTLAHLRQYPELEIPGLPLDFVQNKFPKVRCDDFTPLPADDSGAAWNPPGHGDIYMTLQTSGILDALLERGYRYMFVSNSDNLGAVADFSILTYFARSGLPFLMEVSNRTAMDSKGGHLAQTKTGRLLLREAAQCPEEETAEFQNIEYYRFFNTNNLWIDLVALRRLLDEYEGVLPLPMILNPKTVGNTPVYQIETAMGTAISVFEEAGAIVVPRDRFAPVKKTDDLLSIWSDAYCLTDDQRIVLHPELDHPPVVRLDTHYYRNIEQLQERCAEGIPSLLHCRQLTINGDVFFGPGVEFAGEVNIVASERCRIENEMFIGDVLLP